MNRDSFIAAAVALPLLVVGGAGCSGGGGGGATVAWSADAASTSNPWPSNRLLAGGAAKTPVGYFQGALTDTPAHQTARDFLQTAATALEATHGYSVYAPIVVPVSKTVDATALAGVHLYPEAGGADVAVTLAWDETLHALTITPTVPLAQKTTYELAIADPLLHPSGEFKGALGGELATLAANAVSHGVATLPTELDLVLDFTTQPIADDLQAIQTRIDSPLGDSILPDYGIPAPSTLTNFPIGVFSSTNGTFSQIFTNANAKTTGIGTVAQGLWPAYDFRDATTGLFDESLIVGSSLTPSTGLVDFRMTIPQGPVPTGGWPIVIISHGVSGDSTESLQRAYSFAQAGMATIGLTATDHGWRGSILDFFDFTRLLACRDEFRQSADEILQMERMLRNAHAAGIAPFDAIDPAQVHYFGNSFGGLLGGQVTATSSHLGATGLTVAGGRLTQLFDGEAGQLLLAVFGGQVNLPSDDPAFPGYLDAFRILAQWGIDPADGGALAPYAPASRHVLLQEALGDLTILNPSTEDLRAALGLPVLTAPANPLAGRGGEWVWDMTQYSGELPAGQKAHDLYWNLPEMRHQMEQFLLSDGTTLVDQ